MDEKELKKLTDSLNQKFDDLNELVEKKAESEKMTELTDAIREDMAKHADKEYVEKMQEQLDAMETKISDMELNGQPGEPIEKQFDKMFKSDKYQNAVKSDGINAKFDLKVSTITTSNSFTQTNSPIIPYYRDPQLGITPRRGIVLTNLLSRGAVGSTDYIDWVERTGETTGTKMTAEAAVFGQSDVSWTSYKYPIELISDYIKVSRLKLVDTDFIRSEIMDVLSFNLPHKLETQCFDGTGSSNTLYGLIGASLAKTFAVPSGFSTPVSNANNFDVLRAAMLQVELGNSGSDAKYGGFETTAIILHPSDYANMLALKDADQNGLRPQGVTISPAGVLMIMGVPIYKSLNITAGTYLLGDFLKSKLYTRQGIEIRMWDQNDTDPIYNLVTFTATMRACLVTKNVDQYAFVTGTFAAGLGLIG